MGEDLPTLAGMVVERGPAGTADDDKLNELIENAWRDLLAQQKAREEIADLLGCDSAALDPKLVPFRASVEAGGLTGAEIGIAFAGGFGAGLAKEFGGAAAKALTSVVKRLWFKYVRPRVSPIGSTVMRQPPEGQSVD